MVDLKSPPCRGVGEYLSEFKKKETVSVAAGLLTLPSLSANSIRCETLVHLSVVNSRGTKKPNRTTYKTILNDLLGKTQVAMMEDPQEDVFVSNILTEYGDFRVFNGLWEANDYFVQTLIDIVSRYQLPESLKKVKESCICLLKLSEEVASRSGLNRNYYELSHDKEDVNVPTSSGFNSLSKRVTFTSNELDSLGISVESIEPFIILNNEISDLRQSSVGNSILERKPIVEVDGSYILSIPSAVGIAIRYYFLSSCRENGNLGYFSKLLAKYQAKQFKREILREFIGSYESINPELPAIDNLPSMHAILLKDDSGSYLHAVILHDEIHQIIEEGMASYHTLSEGQVDALCSFFHEVAEYCKSQDDFVSGLSLTTHGGLGRGYDLGFERWPDEWGFSAISLNDLFLLSSSKRKPLREVFECIRQKRWIEDQGVEIHNVNGDFNYFGYWKDSEYKCVPDEISVSENGIITLGTDFVFLLRKDLRVEGDRHSSMYIDGTLKRVERLKRDSFYIGMKYKPIYASLDHMANGVLNGLVESGFVNLWFGVKIDDESSGKLIVYEWWSGFIDLIEEALGYISSFVIFESHYSIQIIVDFSRVFAKDQVDVDSKKNRGVKISWGGNFCKIKLESNFMANFSQVDNSGERLLLTVILSSLAEFLIGKGDDISKTLGDAINHVLGDPAVRVVHIFRSYDSADYLLHSVSRDPKFVDRKKVQFYRICIGSELGLSNKEIKGKNDCKIILNGIVDELWMRIKCILSKVNRRSLLTTLVLLVNANDQDRAQWNRTARAVFAIYSKHDDVIRVARERESDRSLSSLCLRSLIEMALCECPDDSGVRASEGVVDDLLSLTSLLVNTASDSDAIHWGLVAPKIIFNRNGTYYIPTEVMEKMLLPYFSGHFGVQFYEAIDDYEELYNTKVVENLGVQEGVFGQEFDKALMAEYGVLAHQVVECWSEIFDLLVEVSEPILIIGKKELICRIAEKRNIEIDIVTRFFKAFTLYPRSEWSVPPEGFVFRDVAPWKFKRKLSCLVKPVVQLSEDEVFLSLSLIRLGVAYFLDRAKEGEFNTEFFDSAVMRSYVGSMVDKRGAEFTELVSSSLEAQGWYVRKEVLMTTLGASQELGDIDVLAIKDDLMVVFECKKLQMAKTVSEIADVCNRFKGAEKDELRKHLNRVSWCVNNLDMVLQRLNYRGNVLSVKNALLTSTEMPMKYKNDLPITSENIISYRELESWLSTVECHGS